MDSLSLLLLLPSLFASSAVVIILPVSVVSSEREVNALVTCNASKVPFFYGISSFIFNVLSSLR